MKLTSKIPYFS